MSKLGWPSRDTSRLRIFRADYASPEHARALLLLLDAYAQDPAGGGEPLSEFARTYLVKESWRRVRKRSVCSRLTQRSRWAWSIALKAFPRLPAVRW